MPFDSTLVLAVMLLLRLGQMLFLSGSARSKNAAGAAIRLLLDLAVVALVFWSVGAGFLPVDSSRWFAPELLITDAGAGLLNIVLPMCLVATGAAYGAVAERTRVLPMLVFGAVTAVVVPFLLQFSRHAGLPDHGIGLASVFGGAGALVAVQMVGARKGKFNRDLSVNFIPGHNITFQLIGVMLMLLGFSVASGKAGGVVLGASAATLVATAYSTLKFGKIDSGLVMAGTIAGLCAAGVGIDRAYVAVIAGALAGIIAPWVLMTIEVRFRIDDVTGSASTHLVGGLVGLLAAFILAFANDHNAPIVHYLLLIVLFAISGALAALITLLPFKKSAGLRFSESAEFDGTDLSELDVNAYPDFQQTMIKSYHLREV